MRTKVSMKHVVVAILVIIVLYNVFAPDNFLKKSFYPEEYWSDRVASLTRTISYSEKLIDEIARDMRTENASKEIQEMVLDFMKEGIPQVSSIKLATKVYLDGIEAQKLLLEAFTNGLPNDKKLLKEAKRELDKVRNK